MGDSTFPARLGIGVQLFPGHPHQILSANQWTKVSIVMCRPRFLDAFSYHEQLMAAAWPALLLITHLEKT
jgi:hypothetical protein